MKIEEPTNKNYSAVVVRLNPNSFQELAGLDNLKSVSIFGYQILVGKDTQEQLGVFFPAEVQLSDEFCSNSNLYRHSNLNKEPSEKGYLEDSRRVRAVKFKGHVSSGLFLPMSSLEYTGINTNLLTEGDSFDKLNGKDICAKYEVFKNTQLIKNQQKQYSRTDKKFMPEHIDTENFFRNSHLISPESKVTITQKLHGTSIRIANTLVNRQPNLVERIAKFFGAKIQSTEYSYLYGSRKVIKDANNPNQNHFYDFDLWSEEGKKLDGMLPKNYIVYGELIGWTRDGKPLQKGYTYGIKKGECELYIYRITNINEDGYMTDLSWHQVKEFCNNHGLKSVPQIGLYLMSEIIADDFKIVRDLMDVRYFENGFRNTVWLGEDEVVDEGICVRAEGLLPRILKAKAPKFLLHESTVLDTGEEDLESSQN